LPDPRCLFLIDSAGRDRCWISTWQPAVPRQRVGFGKELTYYFSLHTFTWMYMSHLRYPLLGTWCSLEDTLSVTKYTVDFCNGAFVVTAVDSYDGEFGEVSSVEWNAQKMVLSFACYWSSSGRYAKCRMHLFADDKVQFTYTYTDHETLVKKMY
jgi:hypothetical protein